MEPHPSPHATPPADYDAFASAYAADNESNLFNAYYERPEVLRLAGDVGALRVLDAGCGSGALSAALAQRGASTSGFDLSPAMVEIARVRLGAGADLKVGDLAQPFPYPDASFDLAVISLALHYVEDWAPTLAEVRRVLVPGGRLIVSILHPMIYALTQQGPSYFELTQHSEDYTFGEVQATMTYWHRPLQDVFEAFIGAGFQIRQVTEPEVAEDTPPELLPPSGKRRFVSFLFFELQLG